VATLYRVTLGARTERGIPDQVEFCSDLAAARSGAPDRDQGLGVDPRGRQPAGAFAPGRLSRAFRYQVSIFGRFLASRVVGGSDLSPRVIQ